MSGRNKKKNRERESSSSESSSEDIIPKDAKKLLRSKSESDEDSPRKDKKKQKKIEESDDEELDTNPRSTGSKNFGNIKNLMLVDYSAAAYAVAGNIDKYADELQELGGKHNTRLKNPDSGKFFEGYIFPKRGKNTNKLLKFMKDFKDGETIVTFKKVDERGGKPSGVQIIIESVDIMALYIVPAFKVGDKVTIIEDERKVHYEVKTLSRSPLNRCDAGSDIITIEHESGDVHEAHLVCGEFRILKLKGAPKLERQETKKE